MKITLTVIPTKSFANVYLLLTINDFKNLFSQKIILKN